MENKKNNKQIEFTGNIPSVKDFMEAGVHYGHKKSRWHPKMKKFIFTDRVGVHIIDLEKTIIELKKATDFAKKTVASGGLILFVGTKAQGKDIIKKYAVETKMPYITERWIGGLFTNYENVGKLIKTYKKLKQDKASGAFDKYTKKEQVEFGKEIDRLENLVGGLEQMSTIPSAVFILDAKREKTALSEANKKNIKVISFCDSNINPDKITFPIPANDDAIKSIDLITSIIAEAIKEGKNSV